MSDHPRDCPHGRQWGKCDTCEMLAGHERIAELEAELAEEARQADEAVDSCRERIAELEAELHIAEVWRVRAEQAEAELTALKGRRCEDCGWEYCTTEDQSEYWVDDTSLEDTSTDFYCARWKARP